MRSLHLATFSFGILGLLAGLAAPAAHAGCGCQKPPPPPAALRPNVTYAGTPVTFFGSALQAGQPYLVTFTSGTTAGTASVTAAAVVKRDLADATTKTQLVVTLPSLPLGPTSITVTDAITGSQVMAVNDTMFTVAPQPLGIPTVYGAYHWPNYQAAVGRDGTVYVALDLTAVENPIVFEAQARGYPLRFTSNDVVFKNIQGFLMQMLVNATTTQPIPGMFAFPATNPSSDSDTLHYSRHEFTTYFLQHLERQPHAVDPSDGNWHIDGTRHVDHNHLILAVAGRMNDGTLPPPGATPAFDLAATNYSLFYNGLVGAGAVSMSSSATTDSFNRATLQFGSNGDVFTNGTLSMSGSSVINGNATAKSFNISGGTITATKGLLTTPASFLKVGVPASLPNLGKISLGGGASGTIYGPGSFQASTVSLSGTGTTLYIDNSAGPVTLYVDGQVQVSGGSAIRVTDPNPEKFAIYVSTSDTVTISSSGSFYGVVYAPASTISLTGAGELYGAFVGNSVKLGGTTRVHYDGALRGQ